VDIRRSALIHSQNRVDGTDRRLREKQKDSCRGCFYHGGKAESVKCCNYYLITGKCRPCDAGEGCTVRMDSNQVRRKPLRVKNL
jgi:hypothetical protein